MSKMKYSGINWIGNIPKEWIVSKYKYFSESRMGETILSEDTVEHGIPVYSATESNDIFGFVDSSKLILHKNDFVIPARGNSVGFITIVPDDKATCTQTTICSRNIHDISYKYLYYSGIAYKNDWFKYDGSAIPQITVSQINNNKLVIPKIEEQKLIADFLDNKIMTINDIINDLNNEILILNDYKNSLISEKTTKNDGNRIRLKYVCKAQGRIGFKGYTTDDLVAEGEGALSLGASHITNNKIDLSNPVYISWEKYYESPEIMIKKGHILLVQRGSTIGKVAFVENDIGPATINPSMIIIKDSIIEPKYIYYLMLSNSFKQYIDLINTSTAIPMISQTQLYNFEFNLPELHKQRKIAEYLDEKCKQIDEIIENKQRQKEQIEQYKKSVIYEYVTGKKRVEGAEELYG